MAYKYGTNLFHVIAIMANAQVPTFVPNGRGGQHLVYFGYKFCIKSINQSINLYFALKRPQAYSTMYIMYIQSGSREYMFSVLKGVVQKH